MPLDNRFRLELLERTLAESQQTPEDTRLFSKAVKEAMKALNITPQAAADRFGRPAQEFIDCQRGSELPADMSSGIRVQYLHWFYAKTLEAWQKTTANATEDVQAE